jgi:Family of unknown function (DUF6151)
VDVKLWPTCEASEAISFLCIKTTHYGTSVCTCSIVLVTSIMSERNVSSTSTLTTALTVAAVTAGAAIVVRTVRRHYFSPTITCKLSCRCGQIQGTVSAKKEDSAFIYCYCQDCRDYATFIAQLGGKPDTTIGKEYGDNRIVQVCKSAVTITKGQDKLLLARKAAPNKKSKQVYMHRYYAGCCHVPLMNTVSFLGFVGVLTDFLDGNHERYDGPCRVHQQEAWGQPDPPLPDAFIPAFIWKVIRYLPWRHAGPFDYQLTPVYWGEGNDKTKVD